MDIQILLVVYLIILISVFLYVMTYESFYLYTMWLTCSLSIDQLQSNDMYVRVAFLQCSHATRHPIRIAFRTHNSDCRPIRLRHDVCEGINWSSVLPGPTFIRLIDIDSYIQPYVMAVGFYKCQTP